MSIFPERWVQLVCLTHLKLLFRILVETRMHMHTRTSVTSEYAGVNRVRVGWTYIKEVMTLLP